ISIHHVDTHRISGKPFNYCTQRVSSTAFTTNYSAKIVRMDMHAQHFATSIIAKINLNVFGIINDPLNQVFQRLLQHGHYSAASSDFSSAAAASGVRAASGVGSGASGSTTEPLSGTTKASFSAGCFIRDSSYSSPLNFCQSPVSFSKAVTCLDG